MKFVVRKLRVQMPLDMVFSNLFWPPGKLVSESISEVGTSLGRIQLPPDDRMIMKIIARGDLQLNRAPNHGRDSVVNRK